MFGKTWNVQMKLKPKIIIEYKNTSNDKKNK